MTKLSVVLGDHPHTRPLRDGRVGSDLIELEFVEYDPISSAFDEMVRSQSFDVCEMAIGAFMQGRAADKPIALLPIVVVGGFHHGRTRYWTANGIVTPDDLSGQTLAVRAYSQTTGIWARGILAEQYGVDLASLKWLVTEGSHSESYVDPDNVTHAREGRKLVTILRDGDAIAAILGSGGAEGTRPVIADVRAAEDAWYAEHKVVGINHMVCVRGEIAEDAELTRELYRMLRESHEAVLGPQAHRETRPGIPSAIREGFAEVRPALELGARYAAEQGVIPAVPEIEPMFPDYLVEATT